MGRDDKLLGIFVEIYSYAIAAWVRKKDPSSYSMGLILGARGFVTFFTLFVLLSEYGRRMRTGWRDLLVHPGRSSCIRGRRETFQTLHELLRTFEGSNTPFSSPHMLEPG